MMLVSRGKHGAGTELAQNAHHSVPFEGTLMYRFGNTMLELVPHAVHADGSEPIPPARPERLSQVTLEGELNAKYLARKAEIDAFRTQPVERVMERLAERLEARRRSP